MANIPVALSTRALTRNVEPLLCGQGLEFTNNGDTMLVSGALNFQRDNFYLSRILRPTILRHPGGTLGDTYRWRSGIGAYADRGSVTSPFDPSVSNTIYFGTAEHLNLCAALDAQSLIHINAVTAGPEEAGDWVAYVRDYAPPSRVSLDGGVMVDTIRSKFSGGWWQLGNEPYLKPTLYTSLSIDSPEKWARRIARCAEKMKLADPSIKIGIPLQSDTLGGLTATHYRSFNYRVLSAWDGPTIDFVTMHTGYRPQGDTSGVSDANLWLAQAEAADACIPDLAATRTLLDSFTRFTGVPLFQSETSLYVSQTNYRRALAGGLYQADFIRMLTTRTDSAACCYLALAGNGQSGCINIVGTTSIRRPVYWAQYMSRIAMQGRYAGITITSTTQSTPQVARVPANATSNKITGWASYADPTLRVILINKDPSASNDAQLTYDGGVPTASSMTFKRLSGSNPWDISADSEGTYTYAEGSVGSTATYTMPALSCTLLEIPYRQTA